MIHAAPLWLKLAIKEMDAGISEIAGPGDDPRIVQYHSTTTLDATDDEVPWCSSFVNWCVERAGFAPTRSAMARSWLEWGIQLDPPAYGSIVIISRGGGEQPGPKVINAPGHVGFYVGHSRPLELAILGGNQGDAVSIHHYPQSRVLGFRWAVPPRPDPLR